MSSRDTRGEFLFSLLCRNDRIKLEKGDIVFVPRGLPREWERSAKAGWMLILMQP
ncbi:MAG: hypothetical protein MUE32_00615 [Bacteroidales bacterium]|nr:hypothetical protein [Bacteroidales bacterium]